MVAQGGWWLLQGILKMQKNPQHTQQQQKTNTTKTIEYHHGLRQCPYRHRGGEPAMREPCEVHLSGQKAHGQVGPPSLKSFILIGDERVSASVAKLSAFLL